MDFSGKRVAILGKGVDTMDVQPWIAEQGADITVLDEKLDGKPFGDLSSFDILVRSPGVYRFRPEIIEAEKKGTEVTSKTKIFFEIWPGKIIGVTGTKGKGTTSTLIFEIMKKAKQDVYLGGNIGTGLFDALKRADSDSWMVLELSSFQLVDLHKSPDIAVVLMTTSDHLDWHSNVDEYVEAKAPITKFQNPNNFTIYNDQYPNSVKIGMQGQGIKIPVNRNFWNGKTRLRGEHNRENIAAALEAAKILQIDEKISKEVTEDFRGLDHRLEEVATIDGVTYFDDSFSTTPETTIAAIKSFSEPLILIAGGSEKGADYAELGKIISESENVKAVILIGKMAGRIKQAIEVNQVNRAIKLIEGGKTMTEIVEKCKNIAQSGDVVVLSPAAASFDMFTSYKDRGDQFKREVLKIRK